MRAAYAVAPQGADVQRDRVESLAPSWPVGAHGVALLEAWVTAPTQRWLEGSRDTLRLWKRRLVALCEDLGWRCEPSVANFFCARPGAHDVPALCASLRDHGIKLRDTASFGLPGQVRVSVLAPSSQDALRSAVAALR